MYINCVYQAVEKFETNYPWLFSVLKKYQFQISRLNGILFEYWKVDVNKNVGISLGVREIYFNTLFINTLIFFIKQPKYLQIAVWNAMTALRTMSLIRVVLVIYYVVE